MVLKRDSPNLDILRSLAVTGVLLNHLAQVTPGGQDGGAFALNGIGRVGVLIFFVHTALVLMGSLARLEAKGGGLGLLRAFYVQRFFRLYPLSITCVTVVLLAHFAVPHWRLQWLTVKAVVSNLALVQNLTWEPSVIGPLWSLPYEVQMYLVLPFIYLLTKRRRALLFISILWVVAAALGTLQFSSDPRYLVAPFQFPLLWFVPTFLGGVFAFILTGKPHANLPSWIWPVLLLGIFIVFQIFPIPRTELVMTLLGFAIPQFAETENKAIGKIAHHVAKYSYGIYLVHVPLLEICFTHLHSPGVAARCVLFFLLLAMCSVGAYHLVEKPMIDMGHRLSGRIASKRDSAPALVQKAGA